MKCKLGAIVTGASGSVGGYTIQHSKGGMQIRRKPHPGKSRSTSQYFVRSINYQLHKAWKELTSDQRNLWNDYAKHTPILSAGPDPRPLSGQAFFMKAQGDALFNNSPPLSSPYHYYAGPLGPENVKEGTFNSSFYWSTSPYWSILNGKAHYNGLVSSPLIQSGSLILNAWYIVRFDVSNCPGTAITRIYSYTPNQDLFYPPYNYPNYLHNGSYFWRAQCTTAGLFFSFIGFSAGDSFSLDNFSIRQILNG